MSRKPFDIVAYTYKADIYRPEAIAERLAQDGFPVCPGELGNDDAAEIMLDELAQLHGIDREDEWSFDSGDFPKIIFRDGSTAL